MGSSQDQGQLSASRRRRLFITVSGIALVIVVGTVGFHLIEGMGWVDAFYFENMLATGQGPPIQLTTDTGKVFASAMAFISFGSVLTGLVVTFVPIISQLWREGLERAEREVKELERDISGKKKPEESG